MEGLPLCGIPPTQTFLVLPDQVERVFHDMTLMVNVPSRTSSSRGRDRGGLRHPRPPVFNQTVALVIGNAPRIVDSGGHLATGALGCML